MNDTINRDDLAVVKSLPKVELHRHLEGAVRLQTLLEIAREFALDIPAYTPEVLRPLVQVLPGQPRTAQQFLSKFRLLRSFYRTPDLISRIAREAVEDAAADNVHYMELRFTPKALSTAADLSFDQVIGLVCDAVGQAAADTGIRVRLIVSMNRHESVELGEQTLQAALMHHDKGIVGVDLAGDEAEFPAAPFASVFAAARDAGLGVTIHAGEWAGSESVRVAVDLLNAQRIGHGVRLDGDRELVALLVERATALETCPMSNVLSGVVSELSVHPLRELTSQGLYTTLNTDDPSICDTTLSEEIAGAIAAGLLNLSELEAYTLRAAQAAFLPVDERDELVDWLRSRYAATNVG